jgi:HPt (histidine-containing phosphotransfer) domain-containing protein
LNTDNSFAVDPRMLAHIEKTLGRDLVLRLVALFHEAADNRVELLRHARYEKNFDALRRIAHDLVAEASAIGAPALAQAARRIEARAIAHDAGAFDATGELEIMTRTAQTELTKFLGAPA